MEVDNQITCFIGPHTESTSDGLPHWMAEKDIVISKNNTLVAQLTLESVSSLTKKRKEQGPGAQHPVV